MFFVGPPSKYRNLRLKEVSSRLGKVVLEWWHPVITGRQDLYYNIYINSDSETFTKLNAYPLVKTEYILSGLQPFIKYKVKVSANNGVSASDKMGESKRICEVSWTM